MRMTAEQWQADPRRMKAHIASRILNEEDAEVLLADGDDGELCPYFGGGSVNFFLGNACGRVASEAFARSPPAATGRHALCLPATPLL